VRKEIVVSLGLLSLLFCPIYPYAREATIETTVPAIVNEEPAKAVNEERTPVRDSVVLPVNEPLVVDPQNKMAETVKDESAATSPDPVLLPSAETPVATPAPDPVLPPATEPLVVEPQTQGPPQERMNEEFSKELAAADAAARKEEEAATRRPLGWVFGLRAGIAIPTQKVIRDFGDSTSIGPLVNVEALYAVKEWMRVGLMVEWHRHSIKMWGPEFGTLNTVGILPTIEFRPTRDFLEERGMGAIVPYGSLGLGVNANSLSKGSGLPSTATVSFDNTLAFRAAGGIDVPIALGVSLNAEVAYNLNSGGYQLSTLPATTDFNASTVNLLFGIRAEF